MISSDQISVVVQGALDPALIFRVLKSVRETLPNSRIILSTWKGSPCLEELRENKLYDDLLLNEDPGAYYFGEWDKKNNLNRMLLSTQQGLSLVRTKYTLCISLYFIG